MNNIASIYDDIGQPTKALELSEQALPIGIEVGDKSGEAATLNNIGLLYGNIGPSNDIFRENLFIINRSILFIILNYL